LTPCEIGGRSQQLVRGLIPQVVGINLRPIRQAANESGELWGIFFEIIGCASCRTCDMTDHVSGIADLMIHQSFGLLNYG